MKLLENAINSIQVGLDDFENGEDIRIISSVRNLYAGIILLFKEKLVRMSPDGANEVLLRSKIIPQMENNGSLVFVGFGKNTVTRVQIKERFNNLNIKVDWKAVDRIAELRNDLEHYYSHENNAAIREVLSKTFVIIRDFITHQLNEDPLNLLGDEYWNRLLDVYEVFEKEKNECDQSLGEINWESEALADAIMEVSCPECNSSLIMPQENENAILYDTEFSCRSCGNVQEFENVADDCLKKFYSFESYLVITEGADPVLEECPSCFKFGYVIDEERCVICGYEREYDNCNRCGNELSLDEQHLDGFCSHCEYIMSKDD